MSSGFYRNHLGHLSYAENQVLNSEYVLLREDKDELIHLDIFPIDGWYWFDSKDEAVSFLGVDFAEQPTSSSSRKSSRVSPPVI